MKVALILNALAFTITNGTVQAGCTVTLEGDQSFKCVAHIDEADATQKTNTLAYIEQTVRPILIEACKYADGSGIEIVPEDFEVVITKSK